MKLSTGRDEFAAAVAGAAQGIPGGKPERAVYAGMLISVDNGTACFTGSDGSVAFRAECTAEGEGSVILPGRLFADLVKYLPRGQVTLAGSEMSCGKSRFSLTSSPGKTYPEMPHPEMKCGIIPGDKLVDAIKKVIPATAKDHRYPALTSVMLDCADGKIVIAASDRYRMGMVTLPFEGSPGTAFLPSSVAERFARSVPADDPVSLGWSESLIRLRTPGLTVTTRQITDQGLLDWHKVLKKQRGPWVRIDTTELSRVTRMISQIMDGFKPSLILTLSPGELRAEYSGKYGKCSESIPYEGPPGKFRVGIRALLDGLAGCDGETDLSFVNSPGTRPEPLFLKSGSYLYMIQPQALDMNGEKSEQEKEEAE